MEWGTMALAADVRLDVTREMPPLPPEMEAVVAHHWAAANARRPLFNGRVFSVDTISSTVLGGHWTEYRRVVAQMEDPALFGALQIRSLAVCGALHSPDGIAVGRREPASSYLAGLWQLPPAGSVDHGAATAGGADWRTAILAELREELGLLEADISGLRPIALVQHPSGVLDMGIRIATKLDGPAILDRHRRHGDGEYDALMVLPAAQAEAAVAARGGAWVPTARLLLHWIDLARMC